jgi:hypothetical protein
MWGLDYTGIPGWATRGAEFVSPPVVVIGHHTATSARARGDLPTLGILRDGRGEPNPLRGPLCQLGLGRSGHVYIVASGKANHAGAGEWLGLPGGVDYNVRVSSRTVGIEAEHPGDGSPWPKQQLDTYDRLIACLLWGLEQEAEAYCGHREWALPVGRKPDPKGIDLGDQRTRVGRLLAAGPGGGPTPPPATKDDDMLKILYTPGRPTMLWHDGRMTSLASNDHVEALKRRGVPVELPSAEDFSLLQEVSDRLKGA